jgi:hypothetical protein
MEQVEYCHQDIALVLLISFFDRESGLENGIGIWVLGSCLRSVVKEFSVIEICCIDVHLKRESCWGR